MTFEELFPPEVLEKIPPLYGTEHQPNPVVCQRLYYDDFEWQFFVTEIDPEQQLCFGLVLGWETELGYFSVRELLETPGKLGLPVQRDTEFKPIALRALQEQLRFVRAGR